MKLVYLFYTIIFSFILMSNNASSQEDHSVSHHFSIFGGANSGLNENSETVAVVGGEYEYIFSETTPNIGLGILFEAAMYDEAEMTLGLPLFIHAYKGIKVIVAPSVLITNETSENTDNGNENELNENTVESDNKYFIRMGIAYDLQFNNFSISPSIMLDQIGSKSFLVYGINFGIAF